MNVLFLLGDSSLKGGTERSTIEIANNLAYNKDNRVFILSIYRSAKEDNQSFAIEKEVIQASLYDNHPITKNFFFKALFYLRTIYKLLFFLKRNKINLLISVEVISVIFTYPTIILIRFFGSIKYVVWEHFNFTVNLGLKLRDFCRKIAAKSADAIITLTDRDKRMWSENLFVKGKIISIPNSSPFEVTNTLYNSESKKIIAIGRLVPQKGFDLLIDVWKYLYDNYIIDEEWILQIIGDGPDSQELSQKIKNYNLQDKIILVPANNQIDRFYTNASFLCMTSRFEGLPMTLIEAKSFGLPIVSYNCITGPEEIISEESGFLVEMNDFKSFAEKVYCLMNNSKLRFNMSNSSKKEVMRFSAEEVLLKWENLLKEI
ncbi:glycosyltransferase family 4 protein [Flavobacterium johnsoniae]|uniref:Glycosyltransferase involved in cell wall bisynthesis n=1 Tax=Flavobacterium johnsoniae TaxID=986 RepID=A0A1M5L4P7_FLAJO|nr:glycosyltransferase family 4 protein [Flavobacterium johnsoniae]SHG59739.1 Glycosyltransferase involved in cell wall bisynthesis [Flavobacterium johnsoniae]